MLKKIAVKIAVSMASLLLIFSGNAFATDAEVDIDISLACPTTVSVGEPLNVTVTAENYEMVSIALNRYMAAVIANGSDTVGAASFYGPFAKTLGTAVNMAPGGTYTFKVPVIEATPDVPNKMALVSVEFITVKGKNLDGNTCLVNIVP